MFTRNRRSNRRFRQYFVLLGIAFLVVVLWPTVSNLVLPYSSEIVPAAGPVIIPIPIPTGGHYGPISPESALLLGAFLLVLVIGMVVFLVGMLLDRDVIVYAGMAIWIIDIVVLIVIFAVLLILNGLGIKI